MVTIEIDIEDKVTGVVERIVRTVDPEALSLGFLEDMEAAQESKRWRDLIPAVAGLLGLTREQTRHVSIGQFKQITAALNAAGQVDPTPA